MKPLIKIMTVISLLFASTFIIARLIRDFSVDDITLWLEKAETIDPLYVCMLVVLLLFLDIFIAVPTLTITILSGYFLGPLLGGIGASLGMVLAGITGHWLGRFFGEKPLKLIIRSETKRSEAKTAFNKYGFVMILLSRSSPILPEVSACMSGITKMKFPTFILAWLINTVPYAFISAYSGSISSLSNPKPAIYTAIAIYVVLWGAWYLYRKRFGPKT